MIYELREEDFIKSLLVMNEISFNNAVISIIERKAKGRIWVDNPKNPKSVFIWDKYQRYFLAGESNNNNFNQALIRLFRNEIYPIGLRENLIQWTFYFSENWEKNIIKLFKEFYPMKDYRRYYNLTHERSTLVKQWHDKIPEGFALEQMNKEFLKRTDLTDLKKIIDNDLISWYSLDVFDKFSTGFCLIDLQLNEMASWCFGEYASDERSIIEVGIETNEKYQQRGFAAITGAAFIEYSLAKKQTIGWHCWETNIGSIKTAEKLGYQFIKKYAVFFGWYNIFDNFIVNGFIATRLKDYKKAIKFYLKGIKLLKKEQSDIKQSHLLKREGLMADVYYRLTCAWAQLKKKKKASRCLEKAIQEGFKDYKKLEQENVLKDILNTKKWKNELSKLIEKKNEL